MNLIFRLSPNLGHPNFPGNAEKTNERRQHGWSQVEINLAKHDSDDRSTLNHNNLFHDDV